MLAAFALAKDVLPKFTCKFSRKDFTLPQLFACLALREHQKKSYRGIEALRFTGQAFDGREDDGAGARESRAIAAPGVAVAGMSDYHKDGRRSLAG